MPCQLWQPLEPRSLLRINRFCLLVYQRDVSDFSKLEYRAWCGRIPKFVRCVSKVVVRNSRCNTVLAHFMLSFRLSARPRFPIPSAKRSNIIVNEESLGPAFSLPWHPTRLFRDRILFKCRRKMVGMHWSFFLLVLSRLRISDTCTICKRKTTSRRSNR